jgi:hypothetical protein
MKFLEVDLVDSRSRKRGLDLGGFYVFKGFKSLDGDKHGKRNYRCGM